MHISSSSQRKEPAVPPSTTSAKENLFYAANTYQVIAWTSLLASIFYSALRQEFLAELLIPVFLAVGWVLVSTSDPDCAESQLELTEVVVKQTWDDFSKTTQWLWKEILKSFD